MSACLDIVWLRNPQHRPGETERRACRLRQRQRPVDQLPRLEERLHLSIISTRTRPELPKQTLLPYAIDVVSFDQPGVVHEITKFIANNNINIQALYTNSYSAANTGTPMMSLHMTINIPTDVSIAALRGDFMDFCDQLNLDAIMEPVK